MPQRVLVTGGSGFLGKNVCARLRAEPSKYDVIAPTHADYDLTQQDDVRRMFALHRPEIVIHCAAVVGGIGVNRAHPGKFFYENALMGLLTQHAAAEHGVRKFISIGTVCSYPKSPLPPFREVDLWNGYPEETNAPYGIAKKMLLVQGQAYRQEYGFHAIHLILTNLYGPGDNVHPLTSHVIPAMIGRFEEAMRNAEPFVTMWGDGTPTREFLYVADAAEAIAKSIGHYDDSRPLNIGSGEEISIRDLATLIAQQTGFTGSIEWDTGLPNGQQRRLVDSSRAREQLQWRPDVSLKEGLQHTIAWYRSLMPQKKGNTSSLFSVYPA